MRFSNRLYALANEFRQDHFHSNDEEDATVLPDDWRDEDPARIAKGGNYICGHLRRQDFLFGRLAFLFQVLFDYPNCFFVKLLEYLQSFF